MSGVELERYQFAEVGEWSGELETGEFRDMIIIRLNGDPVERVTVESAEDLVGILSGLLICSKTRRPELAK